VPNPCPNVWKCAHGADGESARLEVRTVKIAGVKPLELARGITPDFPSSAGRPFRHPDEDLLARRDELASAARDLGTAEATELAARTWRLWMAARDVPGGRAFLADVLDARQPPDSSRWRVLALYGDGLFAFWAGDAEGARRRNEEAFALAQELDDSEALLYAHLGVSRVAFEDSDHARAREHAAAARALAVRLGEAVGQAPLHMEAQATRLAGDYDGAAELFEQSLVLNRRIDDPSMVPVELHNLGLIEIHRGNADAAEDYFAQLPPSDEPYVQALMRLNRAGVAYRRGNVDEARELLAGVNGEELASDDRAELEWLREQLACAGS
jgi:tetratricopeptide (TPR) repeat protein